MVEKNHFSVGEALEILKNSLERLGIDHTSISINSHNLTPVESGNLVRDLIVSGFGESVTEAGGTYHYSHRPGRYTWVSVEQGKDRINLFYDM